MAECLDASLEADPESFFEQNGTALLGYLKKVLLGQAKLPGMPNTDDSPAHINEPTDGQNEQSPEAERLQKRVLSPVSKQRSTGGSSSRNSSPPSKRRHHSESRSRSRSRSPRRRDRARRRSRSRSRSKQASNNNGKTRQTYSPVSRRSHRQSSHYQPRRYRDGRENPQPGRCLGVFGMSIQTTEQALKEIFSEFGTIDKLMIIRDKISGRSRGFGFVYYSRTKYATRARDELRDVLIDGSKVRIDYSVTDGPPRSERHYDDRRRY